MSCQDIDAVNELTEITRDFYTFLLYFFSFYLVSYSFILYFYLSLEFRYVSEKRLNRQLIEYINNIVPAELDESSDSNIKDECTEKVESSENKHPTSGSHCPSRSYWFQSYTKNNSEEKGEDISEKGAINEEKRDISEENREDISEENGEDTSEENGEDISEENGENSEENLNIESEDKESSPEIIDNIENDEESRFSRTISSLLGIHS